MKKMYTKILLATIVLSILAISIAFSSSPKREVIVNFDYERQTGRATNQFAVWVEDENGNVVKPLFVTRFAGTGGWQKRPDAIPMWSSLFGSYSDVDAMSGSTPQSSQLSYSWDLTDQKGNLVEPGKYVIKVEASLRWKSRVVYSATIDTSKRGELATVSAAYYGDDIVEKSMIQNVKVTTR